MVVISESSWIWAGAITVLGISGFFFIDKLINQGIDKDSSRGRTRMSGAISELQTLVDPAHRHVIEERDRKRGEHDDSGDDPEPHDRHQL